MTFSSYFNVLWNEPRLHISNQFLEELNATEPGGGDDKMIPGNLKLKYERRYSRTFPCSTFKLVKKE